MGRLVGAHLNASVKYAASAGIDADNLKRIFDPFFTTKPIGQGAGLGLSLSYSIAKKHGRLLEVKSVVGQGTKFRVTLQIHVKT